MCLRLYNVPEMSYMTERFGSPSSQPAVNELTRIACPWKGIQSLGSSHVRRDNFVWNARLYKLFFCLNLYLVIINDLIIKIESKLMIELRYSSSFFFVNIWFSITYIICTIKNLQSTIFLQLTYMRYLN